jgi:transposase
MSDAPILPNWTFGPLVLASGIYKVSVSYDIHPHSCAKCLACGAIQRWGKVSIKVHDTPYQGRPLELTISRTRYLCLSCNRTFVQQLPDIDSDHKLTTRAVRYIKTRMLERVPFTSLAEEVGINERTAREVAYDHITSLEHRIAIAAPRYLGIGDVLVAGQKRAVVTDLDARQILDLIASRRRAVISQWLSTRIETKRLEAVIIEPWIPYRHAVKDGLGTTASVVVSKPRVLQAVDRALDDVCNSVKWQVGLRGRRYVMRSRHLLLSPYAQLTDREQLSLLRATQKVPLLNAAYKAKEAFYLIYCEEERSSAEKALDAWIKNLEHDLRTPFSSVVALTMRWRREILEYWNHRSMLAAAPDMNEPAKQMTQHSKGCSFRVVRARTLYSQRSDHLLRDACCDKCGLRFPLDSLRVRHAVPLSELADSSHPKPLFLCSDCHQQFRASSRSRRVNAPEDY